MAVMTSSTFEKGPLDLKGASYPSTDAMALDAEANGVHDVLFDEPHSEDVAPATAESQPQPTVNGNHSDPDAPAPDPTTNVSSGLDPVAPFLADSQTDANLLVESTDLDTVSVPNAVEAPISDVREEATSESNAPPADQSAETQTTNESTQQVAETQLPPLEGTSGDAMDVSQQDSTAPASESAPTKPMTELTLQTQQTSTSPAPLATAQQPIKDDHEMEDAPSSGKVRSREEDDEEEARDVKRTKTEPEAGEKTDFKVPDAPAINGIAVAQTPQASTSGESPVQAAATAEAWPATAMTTAQNNFLRERVRNTKKIKVSLAFREPVNYVALGIPHYPQYVSNPMDLSTMEEKLKTDKYTYVKEFMEDLDLIVDNSILFNGKDHGVTQAGYNMRAYFLKGMGKMPQPGGNAESAKPPKQPKKPAVPTTTKPRRESRVAASTAKSPTAPPPTATSPTTFPLDADGLPLIRRDSSTANDRPKREIHRPPPKDLPYNNARPRKKKYQMELKFCESVLSEVKKTSKHPFAFPFLTPVDPVALNIPSYRQIIKKPMDFGTIEKNLKAGQYQSAKEFHADAQLVFQNCFKFNPEGDEVHGMGKQLNALFEELWKEKSAWLSTHAPPSDPQSAGSGDSEEEEEEEEEVDPAQAQILAIQKQIAALNETAQSLLQQQKGKRASPKASSKKKSSKAAAPKKKHTLSVPPPPKSTSKSKPRSKQPAPLSFTQKQEISDGIAVLGDQDMRKAVQIIRNGCPHLASVNDDEMEIDMDEISDDTLRELFKFIKQVRGPKGAVDDDDFEPVRPTHKATASKPKKNKPMGKKEQEDSIARLESQLRGFEASASASSQSPPANQDDSSDDDDDSGSESEEE